MDGMPRLPMISPEFKYPSSQTFKEFSSKIKEYILTHYEDDPEKYDAALSEMESLRAKLCLFSPDVETACQVKRYFAQLTLMKSRFPMEEGDPIRISFSWSDRSVDDVNFELACVMYDIGVIHASIATSENRIEPSSIKNAFTHFQCAAYPFQYIRDSMNTSKSYFDSNILTWYVNVLLAQAQECILEKSLIDHRKNIIVAKIATYLKEVYKNCAEVLSDSCASEFLSSSKYKEWMRTCEVKNEIYNAIAMLCMGDQAEQEGKMGVRLTFYEVAQQHVTTALKLVERDKRESFHQALSFLHDVVSAKCTNAKKDNDFIYHDRVPKIEELPTVEPVVMVKPLAFDPTDRSVSGGDLFAALLPVNVLKAISIYTEEKAKFRRAVLERVSAKDQELETYLISLHLDEINLDSSVDDINLPDSLLEISAAFNAQPDAFPELLEKLKKVSDYAVEAEGKLAVLRSRLSAIDLPELTSDEGFLAISKEIFKLTEDHKQARENNNKLQYIIAMHSENLRILAMPLPELNRRITGSVIKPCETAEGAHLKKMLDKAEEMRRQRDDLVRNLTSELDNDDITAKCLIEKDFDNEELFKKELRKHENIVKLIDLNLAAQANILDAFTDANASFAVRRKQIMEVNNSRKDQVLALTAAFEVYSNVLQKANEGLKFYSTLFVMVRKVGEAIEGIEEMYNSKKTKLGKERAEAEEQARKMKEREARDTVRQYSTESNEVHAITAGMSQEFQGGVAHQPLQTFASYGSTMASQFEMKPVTPLTASAHQHNVPLTSGLPVHSAPVSVQQFTGSLSANRSNFSSQGMFPVSSQGVQENSNALLSNATSWSSQIVRPNLPTPYSQHYNPIQQFQQSYSASVLQNTPQTTISPFSQSPVMVPPKICSASLQTPHSPSKNFSSPSGGTLTNVIPMQQDLPLSRPQSQIMHLPSDILRNQAPSVFANSWQQNQSAGAPVCAVQPVPFNFQGIPQPQWQQSQMNQMSQPSMFSTNPALSHQFSPSPVTMIPGLMNVTGGPQQFQQNSSAASQPQLMDLMNGPAVSNLPAPLIPQKSVTHV